MTALPMIFEMQRSHWFGPIREYIRFEAVTWACIKAAAELGMNINDSRFQA